MITTMCISSLGFALLWFAGGLNAQSASQSCSAPRLDGGFFAPRQEIYSHGTKLTYTCNDGRKPAVKGWWATSTCENGTWSHQPQCINENACIPPNIPNGKYTGSQNGWYDEGTTISITCDDGYEVKNQAVTSRCTTGTWSFVPICEKNINACSEPPKIPHAVIIHLEHQEVFAVGSQVQYECADGFTTGGDTNSIVCISGSWTEGPTCRASTTSGTAPVFTRIRNCGRHPNIENADIRKEDQMFLKYQCGSYYRLVGPDTVRCYSDGNWSELPRCEEAFCIVDPAQYPNVQWKSGIGVQYLKEGETTLPCRWNGYSVPVKCINRKITVGYCCTSYYIYLGRCW